MVIVLDDEREVIEKIDKKLTEKGWVFKGAILNYDKAWKKQASVYEKNGEYIVSGLDSKGKLEINESISKEEAEEKIEDSMKEIRKFMIKKASEMM